MFYGIKKHGTLLLCVSLLSSCGPAAYLASSSPEESGLNLMKITDESSALIAGNLSFERTSQGQFNEGICTAERYGWGTDRLLDISPDGSELAYQSILDGQWNILVRKAGPQGSATQRTF